MLIRSIKASTSKLTPISSPSLIQPFSTSHPNQSLFFNKPKVNPLKLLEDLSVASKNDRLDLVSQLYPTLSKSLGQGNGNQLNTEEVDLKLQSLMKFVSKTKRFNLLLTIFNDLPKFGLEYNLNHSRSLLLGMTGNGKTIKGLTWVNSLESTFNLIPTIVEFNLLLNGFKVESNTLQLEELFSQIKSDSRLDGPNIESYNILISYYFKQNDLTRVRQLQSELESNPTLQPNLYTLTTFLTGFTQCKEFNSANQSAQALKQIVNQFNPTSTTVDTSILNALIKFELITQGSEAGNDLIQSYLTRGFKLDKYTLNTVVKESCKEVTTAKEGIELLESLESLLRVKADRRSWTMILRSILLHPQGTIKEALNLYQEALSRSISLDSTFVQPLLTALLEPTPPTLTNFKQAQDIYTDLFNSSKTLTSGPDMGIYVTLLKACAQLAPTPDLEFSRILIGDMRERGIKLNSKIVSWHIITLMKAADSFESAFESYDSIRALDVSLLNLQSYNSILSTFTSLSFPSSSSSQLQPQCAPPLLILEFLSDMRSTLNPPNSHTYTLLLSHFSKKDSTTSSSTIAHLHSLIKLDKNLDPDLGLFNSLMMAYSRVGAFGSSFRIWESLRLNGRGGMRIDGRSVSIFLDSCTWEIERNFKTLKSSTANSTSTLTTSEGVEGRRLQELTPGELTRAEKVWQELKEKGFELNLKNWETFLEYLLRSRKFEKAFDLVFNEMTGGPLLSTPSLPLGSEEAGGEGEGVVVTGGGPKAQKSTYETLLKFSVRKTSMFNQVKNKIRETESEEMWEELQEVISKIQVVRPTKESEEKE